MTKKTTILIIAFTLFGFFSHAQSWEIGIFGGASNYKGDLTYEDPINYDATQPAVGGILKFNPGRFFSIRWSLTYGVITADDAESPSPEDNLRNLSFRSDIIELAFIGELNIMGYSEDRRFSPYLFGGVAGFYFNPKALYQGDWVELQPLGTEGQGTTSYPFRKKYSRVQLAVPFGAGIKFGFGEGLNIGIELGIRKVFTDYLDDVSSTYVDRSILIIESSELAANLSNRTGEILDEPRPYNDTDLRGSPLDQDWYGFGGITITYTLGEGIERGHGCPTAF